MKVLLTGAGGYTGEGVAESLMTEHWVRGFDIKHRDGLNDFLVGDIASEADCQKAMVGIEAVVFCHMASRQTGSYKTPALPMDINVKGTANLYHLMAKAGLRQAVLVSSAGVLINNPSASTALPGYGPYNLGRHGMYCVTKVFQEFLARFYYENHGIGTAVIRPWWIVYDGRGTNKYGEAVKYYNNTALDPRDIGHAANLALKLDNLTLESYELGPEDSPFNLAPAYNRLGWKPKHLFKDMDWDPQANPNKPSRLHPGMTVAEAAAKFGSEDEKKRLRGSAS